MSVKMELKIQDMELSRNLSVWVTPELEASKIEDTATGPAGTGEILNPMVFKS